MSELNNPSAATAKAAQAIGNHIDLAPVPHNTLLKRGVAQIRYGISVLDRPLFQKKSVGSRPCLAERPR
jgi:hypothetical protein